MLTNTRIRKFLLKINMKLNFTKSVFSLFILLGGLGPHLPVILKFLCNISKIMAYGSVIVSGLTFKKYHTTGEGIASAFAKLL